MRDSVCRLIGHSVSVSEAYRRGGRRSSCTRCSVGLLQVSRGKWKALLSLPVRKAAPPPDVKAV
jgi:hypothetical protein